MVRYAGDPDCPVVGHLSELCTAKLKPTLDRQAQTHLNAGSPGQGYGHTQHWVLPRCLALINGRLADSSPGRVWTLTK